MPQMQFIDTAEALNALCASLHGSPWIALDTEFMREKTYYPQLCLIQIASEDIIACIDPLTLDTLDPLMALLLDENITKVLHAAHQDLEIIYHLTQAVPQPLFDTQVAASLLGLGEQIGYGKLVQTLLDVELDKSHTRTDWSRRPLDEAQLRYAADDVRYLGRMYQIQQESLREKGRLDWLADDFTALADPARYAQDPQQAWRRIKGVQRLKGRQLAALATLAAWRENTARSQNKPRKWILADEIILDLARFQPTDEAQMGRIRGLEPGKIKRFGREILGAVEEAKTLPEADWPSLKRGPVLSPDQDALVDVLMGLLRACANQNAISATAIGARKDLERLVLGETDLDLLHGWRAELAGKQLAALLAGQLQLHIEQGRLKVNPR